MTGQPTMQRLFFSWFCAALLVIFGGVPQPVRAQSDTILPDRPTLNFYGVPGLIDMPTAEHQPDGYLNTTIASFGGITRATLSFQILPWISGSFRYSGLRDWDTGTSTSGFSTFYDRSFDIRLRLMQDRGWHPAVTLGFQDFVGTGLFSGEYLVATKGLGPDRRVKVTGGLGWGRLAGVNVLGSSGTRDGETAATGGQLNSTDWFRGDISLFGGVEWEVSDRLSLKLEYSTDDYDDETVVREIFERRSPVNLGFNYRFSPNAAFGGYYMYGNRLGLMMSLALNPAVRPLGTGLEPIQDPILVRPSRVSAPGAWGAGWAASTVTTDTLGRTIETALAAEGLELRTVAITASSVQVRFSNPRYDATAQALGRSARVLARILPPSVETITLVPMANGLASVATTFRRSDLEVLATRPDASAAMLAVTGFTRPPPLAGSVFVSDTVKPRFAWSLEPYTRVSYFDPDSPLRYELGARLNGDYLISPEILLSGSFRQPIVGTLDDVTRASNSVLPRVRSDFAEYDREGQPGLERLTAAYFYQPRPNLFGRVTGGLLEAMHGGVSTEFLWWPVNSDIAIGAELNWTRQRDFAMLFGFQDYDVVTGHVSAYWALGNGFETRVDVGRYLAGDLGGTLTLRRTFANGWEVGAFATLTDVSAEDFGEGSFDKGILLTLPLSWFSGRPSRAEYDLTIRPVQRDGGARLNVEDRLYDVLRDQGRRGTTARWGRFWK